MINVMYFDMISCINLFVELVWVMLFAQPS